MCLPADDAANELGKVLTELSAEFRTKKHHPNWMGIQFVQIGNDAGAKEALEKLTELNTGVRPISSLFCVYGS